MMEITVVSALCATLVVCVDAAYGRTAAGCTLLALLILAIVA